MTQNFTSLLPILAKKYLTITDNSGIIYIEDKGKPRTSEMKGRWHIKDKAVLAEIRLPLLRVDRTADERGNNCVCCL